MATKNEYLKSLMSEIPDIDKANPFEVQRGLDYELVKMGGEVTNETVKKALAKAVKNVLSDANYYTHLLEDATYELLGMKKPNRKKEVVSTEMEEVKKKDNMAPNQMTKAKVVKESLDEKKAKMPDFPDVDGDGDTEEPITKATKEKNVKKEDIDLGHEDDEPDMLKASLYRIAKYAAELYKMLDKYDQMEDEVDFPDWWQEKIHLAKDYLVKAKHYLDFEEKKPSLDNMISMNEAIDGTKKYQQPTSDIKTFDTEEVILQKIYGDNLKNLKKYSVGSYTGDLGDMKGAFFMFAPSGNNFKVYKSSSDFEEYIDKAKNVPANELYPFQQEFMKKAIDTVLYRMPRVTKQPSSLAEIELTKDNVAVIKSLVEKMMKEAMTAKTSDSSKNQDTINRINKVSNTSARQELLKAFNAGKTIDI